MLPSSINRTGRIILRRLTRRLYRRVLTFEVFACGMSFCSFSSPSDFVLVARSLFKGGTSRLL